MRSRKNEKLRNRRDEESRVRENEEFKGFKVEESEDLFSASNFQKTQARPPPGFSALNPILEESPDKSIINPEHFITPDIPKNPNIPEAFTPDLSFMNSNLPQNSYPNFDMNGSNIFSQNGLNTDTAAAKLQMEILKMQLQINNLAMVVGQSVPGVSNATAAVILQGQINNLMQQVQEMQLRSTQLTNSSSQIPNHQNIGSPSPSNFIKFTSTPSESSKSTDFVPNLPSTRSSPIPSNFSYSQLSSSNGNSYQSARSRAGTPGGDFPSNNNQRTNPNYPKEKVDDNRNFCNIKNLKENPPLNVLDSMEDFFKGVPKINEKTETFKNTNPFKTNFTENKPERVSLQSFYDAPPPVPSRDPHLINKPKTEYIKTWNTKSSSDLSFIGTGKDEESFSNLQTSSTPNFNSVSPITEKVKQASKIVYEAGPVMYKKNEPETKTDSFSFDKSHWKPIPPAEEPSQFRETVQINIASFNITKPKSPAERLKVQQLQNNLDLQTSEKDSRLNVTDKYSEASFSLNDFTTSSNWRNENILSSGRLTNNENQNESQEDYRTIPVQRPPAEIFVTVKDTSPNPKSEIFATVTEDRHLTETKPSIKREESLRIPFENGETIDETMYSPATAASYVSRNTNPFKENFNLKNSNTEINHELNGVTKDLGSLKFTAETEESRTESKEVPACQDDSSVCFLYRK